MDQNPQSSNLNQLAIIAALDSRWADALKFNRRIIKVDPQNVDALNRQAHVYMETGKSNLAKKYYNDVLKIDPYNPIALKKLKIIKSFRSGSQRNDDFRPNGEFKLSPDLFLQEPGKTKVVSLLKVAEPQKLSEAFCGMQVNFAIKNRKIIIIDGRGSYLGVMPDDMSHHLIRLIRGGNKYNLFVKSIRVNSLSVLIKEKFRSKRFKNQPSFLENSDVKLSTEIITPLDSQNEGDEEINEEEQVA